MPHAEGPELMPEVVKRLEPEGMDRVVLRQTTWKFGSPSEATRKRIDQADSETLLAWAPRIFEADTVEEMLQ